MTQPSLFDRPIARRSDPDTSHEGAAAVGRKLSAVQQKFLDALRRFGSPATAYEVAELAHEMDPGNSRETYRKRAAEVVSLGHAEVAGKRRCNVTGNNARTYRANP